MARHRRRTDRYLGGVRNHRFSQPLTLTTHVTELFEARFVMSGHLARNMATTWDQHGSLIIGLGPGMNGSGGDNRVYGVGNDNIVYNIGRNTYRPRPPGRLTCAWAGASTWGICANWSCWPRASTSSITRM